MSAETPEEKLDRVRLMADGDCTWDLSETDQDAIRYVVDELERLRSVQEDYKNILKAALYNEPNGVDLVRRLTTYAVAQRNT